MKPWQWPTPIPAPGLTQFLEPRAATSVADVKGRLDGMNITGLRNLDAAMRLIPKKWPGKDAARDCFVVDLKNSEQFGPQVSYDKFSTITKSHAGDLWLTHLQDRARPSEVLAAQGFQRSSVRTPAGCTDKHLYEMAGNAFCVPVVTRIFRAVLPALGYPM